MDFRRVGHFHQQSQGQVLFHHEARPQAALRRRRLLATALRGYGPRAGSAGGERQQMIDEVRQGFHRLRSLFRRARQDRELDAEMSAHLELAIEENLERGLSPAEARRQALVRFGGPQQVKESHREARGLPLLETLLQDFRFALRMLRRSPGFALVAIFCLTLGIGANAAVFSWMEGLLFRPYPAVAHQERLLALTGTAQADRTALSWPDFLDLQRNCKLFDAFFVSKIMGTTLSIGDRAQVATGSIVSSNYFPALGVHPILGRAFDPNEDVGRGAHPVTVISYQLWKERFAGDPQIIGKTQRMNGVLHTIIGVAPEDFYGTFVGWAMKFWVPASMEDTFEAGGYKLEDRGERWIEAYGRLKPGVSLEQAQQEVSAVAKRLETDYPATNRGHGVKLWPLWQTPFNNAGTLLPTLGIMVVVVVFVLLIACANVGNQKYKHDDDEHDSERGEQGSRVIEWCLPQGPELDAVTAVGCRIIRFQALRHRRNFLLRLLEADAGFQAAVSLDPTLTAIFELVTAGLEGVFHGGRHPKLHGPADKCSVKAFGSHANNGVKHAVHALRLADDLRVACEALLP